MTLNEKDMFDRGAKAQALTQTVTKLMFFTEGAPREPIQDWVVARAAYDCASMLRPLF